MDKKKLRNFLKISFIIITILSVVCLISYFVRVANNSMRDDIFETSPAIDILLDGIISSFFFLAEYGIYSGLKYFLLEDEKRVAGYVWAVLKTGCSLFVFLQFFKAFVTFGR